MDSTFSLNACLRRKKRRLFIKNRYLTSGIIRVVENMDITAYPLIFIVMDRLSVPVPTGMGRSESGSSPQSAQVTLDIISGVMPFSGVME